MLQHAGSWIWAEKVGWGPDGRESMQLVNMGGSPWADKEKQEPPGWRETTHLRAIGIPEPDKKGGERQGIAGKECNLYSLFSHYSKISLADKKYASCADAMMLLIQLKKDKNPCFSWEDGAGMKIQKWLSLHSPVISHPFIYMPHITSFPKKLRGATHLRVPVRLSPRAGTVGLINSPLCLPSWPPQLLSKAFYNKTLRASAVPLLVRMVGLATPRLYMCVHACTVCMHTQRYAQSVCVVMWVWVSVHGLWVV